MIEELNGDFLQWLRGFYYVAQTGSIRSAAQMMNRNPSTISYQLKSLETELNTVLFDRYKKTLRITPEGKKLLEWTVYTFETLRGMRSEVGTVEGRLQGPVTFSSDLPFAAQIVGLVSGFRERHPEVNINIRRALTHEVVSDVESSRVDFGLTGLTDEPKASELEELLQARPLLIVHKDNPYKLPRKPGPEVMARLPFVSFFSEAGDAAAAPHFGLNAAARPLMKNVVLSVNNYHLLLRYVLHGVGAAIMDELCLKASSFGADWRPLKSYPLDDFLPIARYGILVRKRKHLSPQAKALMEAIRSDFRLDGTNSDEESGKADTTRAAAGGPAE